MLVRNRSATTADHTSAIAIDISSMALLSVPSRIAGRWYSSKWLNAAPGTMSQVATCQRISLEFPTSIQPPACWSRCRDAGTYLTPDSTVVFGTGWDYQPWRVDVAHFFHRWGEGVAISFGAHDGRAESLLRARLVPLSPSPDFSIVLRPQPSPAVPGLFSINLTLSFCPQVGLLHVVEYGIGHTFSLECRQSRPRKPVYAPGFLQLSDNDWRFRTVLAHLDYLLDGHRRPCWLNRTSCVDDYGSHPAQHKRGAVHDTLRLDDWSIVSAPNCVVGSMGNRDAARRLAGKHGPVCDSIRPTYVGSPKARLGVCDRGAT